MCIVFLSISPSLSLPVFSTLSFSNSFFSVLIIQCFCEYNNFQDMNVPLFGNTVLNALFSVPFSWIVHVYCYKFLTWRNKIEAKTYAYYMHFTLFVSVCEHKYWTEKDEHSYGINESYSRRWSAVCLSAINLDLPGRLFLFVLKPL